MKKGLIAGISVVVVVVGVALSWLASNAQSIPGLKHAPQPVLEAAVIVLGLAAAAVMGWLVSGKLRSESSGAPAAAGGEEAEVTDLDELLREAEARLHDAQLEKNAGLAKLPAILVVGETGSAKTSTVIKCGLNPELLAGQIYEENKVLPTPTANFWVAQRTVFVEMAGKLLGDSASFGKVIGRLRPGKAAAIVGSAKPAARAALVCVDAETLLAPGPDPLAATARKLRGQLGEISEQLGIDLPVYVLFTRTDRIAFFTEYFSKLNEHEAARILGATLPVVENRKGVYAEEETARLNGVFEGVFRQLANARIAFLPRETGPEQLSAVYEFPREFRKLRAALVRFLVEMGRPSQLNAGPFLRGFYFSGVRPVVVNEVAPPAPAAASSGQLGATVIFSARGAAQPAQRVVGTRKVPQWLFLGHLFTDLLLGDPIAKAASETMAGASLPRCVLLGAAAVVCLGLSLAFAVSYGNNRALEQRVIVASRGIAAADASAPVASLDSLEKLDSLRQTLGTLGDYQRGGAPWGYRWGLYAGSAYYPDVRRLYFAHFKQLLLGPTQNTIVDSLRDLPATPGPAYGPTYDSLKAYLITTSNPDKSTREWLAPVLLDRWSANRNVDQARLALARKQFEFYADELRAADPYPADNDAAAIGKARAYLAQFAAVERVYQAMLADAAKAGPSLNFNRQFPGSAETVVDSYEVAAPFTKPGWAFMRAALKNPDKYFAGEAWVLGNQSGSAAGDRAALAQQLTQRYDSDFIKAWRTYLQSANVLRYASLKDAAKKLGTLSGNQSPLLALFWLASQNTAVDAPEVANVFQPVQAVVPPSSVDRYIAPPNQGYMNAMVTLQTSVETVAGQPQGNDAAAAATLTNATAAKVAARQIAQTFRIDPDAHVEATAQKLLEDPITNVEALLRNLGPAELNGKGKGLCTEYRGVFGKYPFNPTASAQATVADVNGIFRKPDGALWKFYADNLQKLLPRQGSQYVAASAGGVTLSPAFVAFFNQAAAFSDFLYAGGTQDPHFTYTLKPVPAEGIQTVGLHLDGQAFSYSGGDAAAKQFVWQAAGTHEAKATVKFGGGPDLAWSSNDGLWAVFQFFHKAETWTPSGSGNTLEWVIRIGKDPVTLPSGKALTVRFELDMAGGPAVFQKGFFNRMACVAEVAKP